LAPIQQAEVSLGEKLKRLLQDPNRHIEAEDFVDDVTQVAREALLDVGTFPTDSPEMTDQVSSTRYLVGQAHCYENTMTSINELLVIGCTYGKPEHNALWARAMQTVANADRRRTGKVTLIELQKYPTLLSMYAGSIAAIHRKNYGALKAIAVDAGARKDGYKVPLVGLSHPYTPFESWEITAQVLASEEGQTPLDELIASYISQKRGRKYTPVSDYLHGVLRPLFSRLIPDQDDYDEIFDDTEILLAVIATDLHLQRKQGDPYLYGPWFGRFTWRNTHTFNPTEKRLAEVSESAGSEWGPLRAGLFGGSEARAKAAFGGFVTEAARVRSQRW
jgi:hypothetical protein